MQRMKTSTGLLSSLCLLFLVNSQSRVQAGLAKGTSRSIDQLNERLSEYDIVEPFVADPRGQFLSYDLTSPAKRRGVRSVNRVDDEERSHDRKLHLKVKAFGSDLLLELMQNTRLIAPHAKVERYLSNGTRQEEEVDRNCFYVGEVKNVSASSVAISNCNGLAGLIRMQKEDLFIEPLEEHSRQTIQRKHVIYRRSAIKKPEDDYFKVASSDFLRTGEADEEFESVNEENERTRRAASGNVKNVEVLLGADYSVMEYHGTEHVQMYILTLMNIVNSVYKHSSLGYQINIVLVRIVLLDNTQSNLIYPNYPSRSLENVCRWASAQQKLDVAGAAHHDHAIFLTRQDFGPAGYAPVGSMCHPVRSCTLNKEDGFTSAFVVAHETGHVFGMEHDGQGNSCSNEADGGSIMAPLVTATFLDYFWSRCSSYELGQRINSFSCLNDDPFEANWPELDELPGVRYSVDKQCQLTFGPGYKKCSAFSNFDPCQELWCSTPENRYICKTKNSPALDGTKCAEGKWCYQSQCVPSLKSEVVDGGFSQWSSWGQCSLSCGTGAQIRTRECNQPKPAGGGKDCKGPNVEFQLCNKDVCPGDPRDLRAEQCTSNYADWRYKNRLHTWLPHESTDRGLQCKLSCISQETDDVVTSTYNVIDGTPCSYENSNRLCIQGQCQKVGCDNVLGSDAVEDDCGVCGGDGSQCATYSGIFEKDLRKAYQRVIHLPKGARNIEVYEVESSPHLIALKDRMTGHYLLNNRRREDDSKSFVAVGTRFTYDKYHDEEVLTAKGPLFNTLVVLVHRKSLDKGAKIVYSYTLDRKSAGAISAGSGSSSSSKDKNRVVVEDRKAEKKLSPQAYGWEMAGWSPCSQSCGGGVQYFQFVCKRAGDGEVVNRKHCEESGKHSFHTSSVRRKCNVQQCHAEYKWRVSDWEECSHTCGEEGLQHREVDCVKEEEEEEVVVAPRNCPHQDVPVRLRACNRVSCPHAWHSEPWSECSTTCGQGVQAREVTCRSSSQEVVADDEGHCAPEDRPTSSQACNLQQCSQECLGDKSPFCQVEVLNIYCELPGYSKLCCRTCNSVLAAAAAAAATTRAPPLLEAETIPALTSRTPRPLETASER